MAEAVTNPTPEISATPTSPQGGPSAPLGASAPDQPAKERAVAFLKKCFGASKALAISLVDKAKAQKLPAAMGGAKFQEGMSVEARFKEKDNFFAGTITKDNGDGTYAIDYEDGEQEFYVKAKFIRDPNSPVDVIVVASDAADADAAADAAESAAQKKFESSAAAAKLAAAKKVNADAAQKEAAEAAAAAAAATDPVEKAKLEKVSATEFERAGRLMLEWREAETAAAKNPVAELGWLKKGLSLVPGAGAGSFAPSASQKLQMAKLAKNLPAAPKNRTHAMLLIDNCLNRWVPHWLRYWVIAGVWHVFPFWYGTVKAGSIPGQCSEDLLLWMQVCGNMSCGRLFGVGSMNAVRIRNRPWHGQNFGEAIGELFNKITDGADELDPSFMQGERRTYINVTFHLLEFIWTVWGWAYYANIQVCDSSVQYSSLWLLLYQTFNLLFLSSFADFVWPWCYLEWQKDVDVITKKKKPPPRPRRAATKKDGGDDDEDEPMKEMMVLDSGDGKDKDGDDDGKPAGGGGDPGANGKGAHAQLLSSMQKGGEPKAEVQARAAAKETTSAWEDIGNPAATPSVLGAAGANAAKPPKPAALNLKRKGRSGSKKQVGPSGDVAVDAESGKPLVGGSQGGEWWRQDGRAPPRKAIGGVYATAAERASSSAGKNNNKNNDKKEEKKAEVEAERPKTSGGKRSGWFGGSSKVQQASPTKNKLSKPNLPADARPKTAPARS